MTGNNNAFALLTTKQREVLALVADNRTSKEIASLLGISESAVNQRIEMVRSRVGGLPRGELARLYRQSIVEREPDSPQNLETWQKIQVSDSLLTGNGGAAESAASLNAGGSHRRSAVKQDETGLPATLFQADNPWLWRKNSATALVRLGVLAAIAAIALVLASDLELGIQPFDF